MLSVNQKIVNILRKDLGINKQYLLSATNLISEYNLCNWELDLLYVKIETTFNIEIDKPIPKEEVDIISLENDVRNCLKKLQYSAKIKKGL